MFKRHPEIRGFDIGFLPWVGPLMLPSACLIARQRSKSGNRKKQPAPRGPIRPLVARNRIIAAATRPVRTTNKPWIFFGFALRNPRTTKNPYKNGKPEDKIRHGVGSAHLVGDLLSGTTGFAGIIFQRRPSACSKHRYRRQQIAKLLRR